MEHADSKCIYSYQIQKEMLCSPTIKVDNGSTPMGHKPQISSHQIFDNQSIPHK